MAQALSLVLPRGVIILPAKIAQQLEAHCFITGDDPHNVVCDALALHFDDLDGERAEHEPYVVKVDDDLFADQVADTVQP